VPSKTQPRKTPSAKPRNRRLSQGIPFTEAEREKIRKQFLQMRFFLQKVSRATAWRQHLPDDRLYDAGLDGIFRTATQVDPTRANKPETFIGTGIRNGVSATAKHLEYQRAGRRPFALHQKHSMPRAVIPVDPLEEREEMERLHRALDQLPTDERLLPSELHGLVGEPRTIREIARDRGHTVGTIRSLRDRAYRFLRLLLERKEPIRR
jgi:hypothetical protein